MKKRAEAAKLERQRAKEERDQANKAKAKELTAARELKKQQREAATLQYLAINQTRASGEPQKALITEF